MRFLFRAIFFGILTGAFFFFFPFHFFLFPVLLFFIVMRLFFRPWRWRHRHGWHGPYGHRFAGFGPGGNDAFSPITPIDGYDRHYRSGRPQDKRDIHIQ